MLFNSIEFAIFFPVVTLTFFALPHRFRGAMLLIASCYFYMAFIPKYILILFFTIGVDFLAGLMIERATGPDRRLWLGMSLAANVGILAFFKYFNFLTETVYAVVFAGTVTPPPWNIILPIGLSFHTFQSMSYVVEVYRGVQPAERNLLRFALYVMFYPQLVAGPIERPQNMLHQFRVEQRFEYDRAKKGLQLIAWGLFKKVAVADRVAAAVNLAYADPTAYSGKALLLATYLFAIQIYCDFSGYSDIAIGSAQVMGFTLMQNFERPYFSRSVGEFWRRWHISLSTWFRDYVYVPLGGSHCSTIRRGLNLLVVFAISGLWHGASWNFVMWGVLNGLFLVTSMATAPLRQWLVSISGIRRLPVVHSMVRGAITFHLILLSWVFFRATTLGEAVSVLQAIVTRQPGAELPFELIGGKTMVIIAIAALLTCEIVQSRTAIRETLAHRPVLVRWPAYAAMVIALLLLGNFSSAQQFIYFQF